MNELPQRLRGTSDHVLVGEQQGTERLVLRRQMTPDPPWRVARWVGCLAGRAVAYVMGRTEHILCHATPQETTCAWWQPTAPAWRPSPSSPDQPFAR
jgi:hypothetical protein